VCLVCSSLKLQTCVKQRQTAECVPERAMKANGRSVDMTPCILARYEMQVSGVLVGTPQGDINTRQ